MGKREPLDDGDDCPGCERAPPTGYYLCPVCDAEYLDEEPHPTIWQPIETAPRDGTTFLAVVDGSVRLVEFGKTSHLPWRGFCLADQGVEDFDICTPTHWMPLPEAPTHD